MSRSPGEPTPAYMQLAKLPIFTRKSVLASIAPAINYHLPNDIVVHQAEDMPEGLTRVMIALKRYRYRIYNGPQETALHRTTSWWIRAPLELEAMREAAGHFLGENDFNAFRSVHCDAEHAYREMFSVTIDRIERPPVGQFIDIVFHANAFCRHSVEPRGTLAEVGMGKFSPDDIPAIMASRDRRCGGRTAPPGGLTLPKSPILLRLRVRGGPERYRSARARFEAYG